MLLGGEENSTREQMRSVVDFETKLAAIMQPLEDLRDGEKLYHLMAIKDLEKLAPFVSIINPVEKLRGFPYHITYNGTNTNTFKLSSQ